MDPARLILTLLVLAASLGYSAASYPSSDVGVYWQDEHWNRELLAALESSLHYPDDASGLPLRPVPESVQATVGFTYIDGKIQDPVIIKTSGRSDLDAAFLSQIISAQPPKVSGGHAAEPRPFYFTLTMRTPREAFETAVCKAIDAKFIYPKDAILAGQLGVTILKFQYHAGKASVIALLRSSGSKLVDEAFMQALGKAQMPPAPAWLPAQPLAMKATLGVGLGESGDEGICSWSKVEIQTPDNP